MKTLLGFVMAGGLLLVHGSAAQAQVNLQFGRNGTPSVSFGQPAYGQYASPYGQPYYGQPGYSQPGYAPRNYVQPYGPSYYSSGYSSPARTYAPGYNYPGYGSPAYASPYRAQAPYYGGGYTPYAQPSYGTGTGVIINGRSYTLPR